MNLLSVIAASRRRGGAFDPLSLTPALWLSDTGADAATWPDISGNSRNATQATPASQPSIVAAALNGRQVRRFAGTDDFMVAGSIGDFNFLHNGGDGFVCVVAKMGTVANPDAAYSVIDTGGAATAERGYFIAYDDRSSVSRNDAIFIHISRSVQGASAVNAIVNNTWTPNAWHVVANVVDADNATAADRSISYIDNGAAIKGNSLTNTPSASNSTYELNIGRSPTGGGVLYAVMDIAEVFIANRNPTTQEREDLQNYFANKYGLTML